MRLCSLAIAFIASVLMYSPGKAGQSLPDSHAIALERNVEKFLHIDCPIRRLSIGSTEVVDVSVVDGSTLRLLGLLSGTTNISLWRDESAEPEIYTVSVADGVAALNERLDSSNRNSARISDLGGKIVIEGQFSDALAQSDTRELAKFVTGKDVLDLSDVRTNEAVQVEVEVVTVSKTALRGLGLNLSRIDNDFSFVSTTPSSVRSFSFQPGTPVPLDVSSALPIANAFNLLVGSPKYGALGVISALESSNFAQTLARPRLVVRSGEKANFLVGGEIPIPVPQGTTTTIITIQYKRFGISLDIEPTILKNRRIALKVKPEVSELDFANAIALQGYSIPAIRTRQTETTIELNENEPFIISGLMFDGGSSISEKIPYLADIPVLGKLFQRARETHEEQELVVSVTPRLVTSAGQDQSQRTKIRSDIMQVFPAGPSLSGNAVPSGTGAAQ
jgi:pilus assembly protein CpaC